MQGHLVIVAKSQVEIDAGYERGSWVMLAEAKNESVEDFFESPIVLSLPTVGNENCKTNPIMPVFLTFSNDAKFR